MRHVPLEAVANRRSIATISRWEQGQLDVTTDVVGDMLVPLGVDYDDLTLRELVADVQETAWSKVAPELWDRQAVVALRDRLQASRIPQTKNPYDEFAVAVLNQLINIHDQCASRVAPSVVHEINQYVRNLPQYSYSERVLLQAAIEYTPITECRAWIDPIYHGVMDDPTQATVRQKMILIAFCGVLANSAVLAPDFTVMKEMIDMMAQVLTAMPNQPIAAYNYHVVAALYDYLRDHSPANKAALVAVLNTTKLIYPAGYFESFTQYMIEQGWLTAADFT